MKDKKSAQISIRISKEIYDLLELKGRERRKTVSMYVRDIVIKEVDSKPKELLQVGLVNIHEKQTYLDKKIEFLGQLFVFFLTTWFSQHAPIPKEKSEEVSILAEKRKNTFMELFATEIFNTNGTLFDSINADSNEIKEPSKGGK